MSFIRLWIFKVHGIKWRKNWRSIVIEIFDIGKRNFPFFWLKNATKPESLIFFFFHFFSIGHTHLSGKDKDFPRKTLWSFKKRKTGRKIVIKAQELINSPFCNLVVESWMCHFFFKNLSFLPPGSFTDILMLSYVFLLEAKFFFLNKFLSYKAELIAFCLLTATKFGHGISPLGFWQ